jgi:hypothetical protein
MADVLSLYQGACLVIKQRPVASLSENTEARVTLDAVYNSTLAFMLEAGEWRFGARGMSLSPETTVQPSFGYNYFYRKPDDYVRIIRISASPYLWPTLDDFSEEGLYWATNCNPLFLIYVSNSASYGLNMGKWGAHFERAFHYELANRIAPHLTKMGEADLERLEKMTKRTMQEAKAKDSINLPAERPPPGLLVRARLGNRSYDPWSWAGPGTW